MTSLIDFSSTAMLRIVLVLLLSAILTANAQAEETTFVYYSNLAVVRLLKRMALLPKARSELAQPPANTDANLQEIMRYMSRSASDEEVYRAIAATYSRFISINDANRLAKAAPDAKAYAALTTQVLAGEPDYLGELARAYLMQRASSTALRNQEKIGEVKPGMAIPALQLKRTGVVAIDAPLAVGVENQLAYLKFILGVLEEQAKHGVSDPLNPERFMTAAGIAQSRAEIQQLEERQDRFLDTHNRLRTDFQLRTSTLLTDRRLRESFEREWIASQHKELDFTEQQRGVVNQLRRVLDFAESRLGKIHWDGEELTFDEEEDMDVYNALVDKIPAENTKG
jgi:hypothetical protein